ncbi:MAG: FAD-dependent oxidoreductase [Myxococcota bacterium]
MAELGTTERPLRVAIVGSGPSGFYAATALLASEGAVHVDLFDRLPTPFGLVRGGVAPDHQKIKTVTRAYNKTAAHEDFRFIGNVQVGRDVSLGALLYSYDQVILAVGAEADRSMGIPGEDLPGSHSATAFVGWYNGHPDHQDHVFDLNTPTAVVVGVGNVAMDVARILAAQPDHLSQTDITTRALDHLRTSKVRDIVVLGRRGPAQAAFTPTEIKEIDALEDVDVVISEGDASLDPASTKWLDLFGTKPNRQNVEFLQSIAGRTPTASRRVHVRLLTSPHALLGQERVEQVKVGRNQLEERDDGSLGPVDTGSREVLDAGLVLRAVGYRGVPLPGAPFDDRRGIIPNVEGRVVDGEAVKERLYVVGWAKRGPSGLIGTNRADSKATVEKTIEDRSALPVVDRPMLELPPTTVSWSGWERIDSQEIARGQESGKIREKFVAVDAMLDALEQGG